MPNRNYNNGVALERTIEKRLGEMGYVGMRSAGSHKIADVILARRGEVLLIQCKNTSTGYIGPIDRMNLTEWAAHFGGIALVAYRPSPRKVAFYRLVDAAGIKQAWEPAP